MSLVFGVEKVSSCVIDMMFKEEVAVKITEKFWMCEERSRLEFLSGETEVFGDLGER